MKHTFPHQTNLRQERRSWTVAGAILIVVGLLLLPTVTLTAVGVFAALVGMGLWLSVLMRLK